MNEVSGSGQPEVRYAGFWIRFAAHFIDSVLLNVASLLLEVVVLGFFYLIRLGLRSAQGGVVPSFTEAFDPFLVQALSVGFYFSLALPYFVWGHFRYGTTLGKKLFHIYVVSVSDPARAAPITINQSLIRFFAYALSYLPFMAGFVMAAFHPEKRALHDLIAGTVSIRKTAHETA